MPRAKAIAFIVLGSQGIIYTPISLATSRKPEKIKTIRDVGRSIIWIFTKHTGIGHNLRKSEKSQSNCKIVQNLGLTSNPCDSVVL